MSEPDWDIDGFEEAHFDDARPLAFLVDAALERATVCGLSGDTLSAPAFVQMRPRVETLQNLKDLILKIASVSINPYADYAVQNYAAFPAYYTAEDIEKSEHPMAWTPGIGSTDESNLDTYVTFLTDCLFWIRRFRLFAAPYVESGTSYTIAQNDDGAYEWQASERVAEINSQSIAYESYATRNRVRHLSNGEYYTDEESESMTASALGDIRIGNTAAMAAKAYLIARFSGVGVYGGSRWPHSIINKDLFNSGDRRPGSEGRNEINVSGFAGYKGPTPILSPSSHSISTALQGLPASSSIASSEESGGFVTFMTRTYNNDLSESYIRTKSDSVELISEPTSYQPYAASARRVECFAASDGCSPPPGILATAIVSARSTTALWNGRPAVIPSLPDLPNLPAPPQTGGKWTMAFEEVSDKVGEITFFPVLDFGDSFTVKGEPIPPSFLPS